MATPNLQRVGYSSLRFNKATQRYISPQGKFLSGAKVREIVDADVVNRAERMQRHAATLRSEAAKFQAGALSESEYHSAVDTFEAKMRAEIKATHLAHTAAGAGGFHNMSPSSWGRAGQRVRFNYEALANMADELRADPKIATSDAIGKMPFEQRVELYSENGRHSYEAERNAQHQAAGFLYEENVPSSEKSCEGERGCAGQTRRGRVPIGTLIPIGKRSCGPADKCSINYYKSAA